MTRTIIRTAILALLPLSAACTSEIPITGNPALGETVRHNMAVQIMPVGPGPTTGHVTDITGARANVIMDRYNSGNVKPLRNESMEPASGSSGGN